MDKRLPDDTHRSIPFTAACSQFRQRFTIEHIPDWAFYALQELGKAHRQPPLKYYAPQYRTDREWYDNTLFNGESPLANPHTCYSTNHSFPLGEWLDAPYTKQ